MNIFFYDFCIKYNGDSLNKKPLGGSQTALIYISRELAKLKNNVFVFTLCDKEENFDGGFYIPVTRLNDMFSAVTCDVFISLRGSSIFDNDIPAKLKIRWAQDSILYGGVTILKELYSDAIIRKIDKIFTVCLWQTLTFINEFKISKEKFFITRNGVNISLFNSLNGVLE